MQYNCYNSCCRNICYLPSPLLRKRRRLILILRRRPLRRRNQPKKRGQWMGHWHWGFRLCGWALRDNHVHDLEDSRLQPQVLEDNPALLRPD